MRQVGLGKTELETFLLTGMQVEAHSAASAGQWVKTFGSGQASASFNGAAGSYTLTAGYMDEGDGNAPMSISVNGRVAKSWVASANNDRVGSQSVTVSLNPGDTISVGGSAQHGEYARMDWLSIAQAAGGAAPAAPTPVSPAPSSGRIGTGLTELESLSFSGFSVEANGAASAGKWLKTTGTGQAAGTFDGASGTYRLSVGYGDESDGRSPMSVLVNGQTVKSWVASVDNETVQTQSVDVTLRAGDTIAVRGTANGGEYARMDWLKVDPISSSSPAPAPTTPAPAPAPAPVASGDVPDSAFDLFAFGGQSNATGHFFTRANDRSGGALGEAVFEAGVSKALGGKVEAISVGVSGSGSNQYADGSLYWWDINANRPSSMLVDAVRKITAAESGGRQLDGLIWAQGEDDARMAHGGQKDAVINRFIDSTEKIFAYIRDELNDPDLPIFIQELGRFPNDVPADRFDAARGAQNQIVANDPNTYLGARTTDLLNHHDNVHFSNAEYGVIANRLADSVSKVIKADYPGGGGGGGGGGTDTVVLRVSEDAWQGDARFTVKVDGTQVGGTYTATASHAARQTQDIAITGNWTSGQHKLTVDFINDAWGGSASTDRNLYVEDIFANGVAQSGDQAALMKGGAVTFDVFIG